MTLYITNDNKLHDDAGGFALSLPSWPKDARVATQEEIDAITNPQPTLEQIISMFEAGVQSHLDIKAQEVGYDNILTACSYVGAPNPFEEESKTFVAWRGNVWAYCYAELQKVIAGTRPMPTLAQIIGELPVRDLP